MNNTSNKLFCKVLLAEAVIRYDSHFSLNTTRAENVLNMMLQFLPSAAVKRFLYGLVGEMCVGVGRKPETFIREPSIRPLLA